MRLWHYKFIPVLPNKILIKQWQECTEIKRQWEKGILKNKFVNYVMNYDRYYFINYVSKICLEMWHND